MTGGTKMSRNSIQLDEFLKDLEILVNIDSGSKHPAGGAEVARRMQEKYSEMGWQVKKHSFSDAVGPCLEVTNSESPHYDILFMGHMDTVFAVGTAAERPFTVKGGRAYGPGVSDMKAGLLLTCYALQALDKRGELKKRGISVCVAMNSDEEIGSRHSRLWLEKLAKRSRYVFVMEAARSNGALVLRRKGVGRYDIEFAGIAAHAGVEPEKGASAINELGHWIVALHSLTNSEVGTTVNVGVVSGGTAGNVVADKARAEVDVRVADMTEAAKLEEKIKELLAGPKTPGVKVRVSGGINRPPMNPSVGTEKACRIIEAVGRELGIDILWASTGGGSDGNFSAALDVPTIDGLGPIGGGAHGVAEYLEINSVLPRLNLLSELVVRLSGK